MRRLDVYRSTGTGLTNHNSAQAHRPEEATAHVLDTHDHDRHLYPVTTAEQADAAERRLVAGTWVGVVAPDGVREAGEWQGAAAEGEVRVSDADRSGRTLEEVEVGRSRVEVVE